MFADRHTLADSSAHELALDCLAAGLEASMPARAVERHVTLEDDSLRIDDSVYDLSTYDDVLVLGGGKGADDLAAALETCLGTRLTGGVVVTNDRIATPERVDVRLGEHPTPGTGSVSGATEVLDRARESDTETLVLAAITGGASALLCAPAEGVSVDEVRAVTDGLLSAGASIDELNTVRRACSMIKGGGLATAAAPATVVGLLVSDVVGDDPAVIGSGPTVPTTRDFDAASTVLDRYTVDAPGVRAWLRAASPPDSDIDDVVVDNHVIASGRDAVDAARTVATERGFEPCVLSTRIEGEARDAGRFHAAVAAEMLDSADPVAPPAVLLSGGETTVTVRGDGTGGPNLELALAAALELPEATVCAAIDTDGEDGGTDAAGAIVDANTVCDTEAALDALDANDSYRFFDARGTLLRTGSTGTNVNDLRVVVVGAQSVD